MAVGGAAMSDLARGGIVFGLKRPLEVRVAENNQPEYIIPLRWLADGDYPQGQDA